MRRAARIDANQNELVQALRKIGAKVLFLHTLGHDNPDVLVGFRRRNVLLEIKRPGKGATKGQAEFAETWPGETHVVHSIDEAVSAVVGDASAGYYPAPHDLGRAAP